MGRERGSERERESQGVRERGRERRDNEGSIISRRGKGKIERDRKKETEIEMVGGNLNEKIFNR